MVDQVAADFGRIVAHRDAERTQFVGGADARAHQQLRRVERARREDHLGARLQPLDRAAARKLHAARARAVEAHAQDRRVGDQMQVWPLAPIQIRARHCAAFAAALRHLIEADALLFLAVEVVVQAKARLARGLDEARSHRIALAQVGHA